MTTIAWSGSERRAGKTGAPARRVSSLFALSRSLCVVEFQYQAASVRFPLV